MAAPLTVDEVREYTSDYAPNNYLIDGEEFTNTYITLCMDLAVDSFNVTPPITAYKLNTFPSKSVLLLGTCYHMFNGKALLLARNTMQYSDGGIQVPVEERAELYKGLADSFNAQFKELSQALSIAKNISEGWGSVSSDEAYFPTW